MPVIALSRRNAPGPVQACILAAILVCPLATAFGGPPKKIEPRPSGPLIDDPEMNRELEVQIKLKPRPKVVKKKVKKKKPPPKYRWNGPRVQIGYRIGQFACALKPCWYHQFSIAFYPVAFSNAESMWWRVLRFGIGMEGGGETTQDRKKKWQRNHHLGGLLSIGIQYPWRVTPYLDWIFTLGAIHRHVFNKDLFHFAHSVGLEVGAAVYVAGPFNLAMSVGWRRWVMKTEPDSTYYDTVTVNFTFGF